MSMSFEIPDPLLDDAESTRTSRVWVTRGVVVGVALFALGLAWFTADGIEDVEGSIGSNEVEIEVRYVDPPAPTSSD